MTALPVDAVVLYDPKRGAVEVDVKSVPRLEQNSCFARPYRVVTRNSGYDQSMKYKRFFTEEKARAYLAKQLRKQKRIEAMKNWKVIWP